MSSRNEPAFHESSADVYEMADPSPRGRETSDGPDYLADAYVVEEANHPKCVDLDGGAVELSSSDDGGVGKRSDEPAPPADSNSCLGRAKALANRLVPPGGLIASAFTLSSSTMGAGILGLANAFRNMGVGTGCIIMVVMVIETIFALWLIARLTYRTNQHTYAGMVRLILGPTTAIVANILLLLLCFGGAVAYIISIGDILTPIFDDDSVPSFLRSLSGRRLMTSVIWLICILPLTLRRHIDSLRFVSLFGVVFVVFLVVCVVVDSSRYVKKHGMRDDVKMFNTGNSAFGGLGSIVFSLLVQVNAVEISAEIDIRSPARFVRNSIVGISLCGILYIGAALFGYLRFGDDMVGSILLKYQPREVPEFWVAYVGMIVKICVAFVLHQIPIRDGVYHFVGVDAYKIAWWKNALVAVAIATVCLIVGLFVEKITVVGDLSGGLCGAAIGFMFPAVMTMYTGNWHLRTVGAFEYFGCWLLLIVGVLACVFGTGVAFYLTF